MEDLSGVKDALYPKVEEGLKKKENVDKLLAHISKYFDKNNHILFDVNFSERLVISNTDKEIINELTGITMDEATKIIKASKYIGKLEWVCNPFTVLMAMAVKYFATNKMIKEMELCIIYISCYYYAVIHVKMFRLGPPNREIMDYTLNKNPNVINSFIIKKEGSIFGMLKYTSVTSNDCYIDEVIKDCTDVQLNNYLSAIRTRILSNMKNIAKYFYEDHKAGNYFNKDKESFDEDDFHMTTSTSLGISKLSTKISTSLISYRFNRRFIDKVAALDNEVTIAKLSTILDNILDQHRKEIDKFVSTILELFIRDNNKIEEVQSIKFLTHALNIYKTNSTKAEIIDIKSTLDKWIFDGSTKFGNKFIRPASINSYRKAIYMVFVYTINKEAK